MEAYNVPSSAFLNTAYLIKLDTLGNRMTTSMYLVIYLNDTPEYICKWSEEKYVDFSLVYHEIFAESQAV